MFTEHLRKFDELPYRTLLMVAAGLVILCQLAAMAFVADSQVAKARLRDEQRRAELVVIAHCMETSAGPARHSCIQQARVIPGASPPPAADSVMPVHPAQAAHSPQGLMAASFAIR